MNIELRTNRKKILQEGDLDRWRNYSELEKSRNNLAILVR